MHIGHLTNALVWDGTGHTNSTLELAMGQVAAGHEVVMVCRDSDQRTHALADRHGLLVVDGVDTSSPAALWRSARRVRALLRAQDVVHLHTVRTTALAALASPLTFLRRTVATLHNPHQRSAWLMVCASRVVALNCRDARTVQRLTLGLRSATTIHNGMVGGRRLPAAEDVVPADLRPSSVLFVGALHPRKGLDVLLRAMVEVRHRVPEAVLYVVGNRDAPAFERLAQDLGLDDAVHFVGFSDDPRTLMKAASVFVLPSRTEGFGNVVVEARSCGVPVVASDVGGIPEALGGRGAGLLVPPEDVAALAAAVVAVLSDAGLATSLAEGAQRGLSEVSVDHAVARYDEVYAKLQR